MHRDSAATLQRELLALKQKHEATVSSMERQHATKLSEAQGRITDLEEIAMLGEERLMAEQQKAQVLRARVACILVVTMEVTQWHNHCKCWMPLRRHSTCW